MLFGVQKCDGHLPYGTTLGYDLGGQARELASRLMWTARCSLPEKSNYNGKIPRWIFSLVPICRQSFIGTERRDQLISSTMLIMRTETGISSDQTVGSGSTRRSEAAIIDDYSDIAEDNAIWNKERIYFKESVAQGCRYVEQKEKRQRAKKISKITLIDVSAENRVNSSLIEAQNRIADGAEAVRKECSKCLSTNRYNCRTQFFDAVGFILFKFLMDGKDKATRDGFVINLPDLSNFEKENFMSMEAFSNAIPAAYTSQSGSFETDEANIRLIQDLIQTFPNLVVHVEYPVKIVDDIGGQTRDSGAEKVVPDSYTRKETNSLISLSLVILTEYTRSGNSGQFLKCSKKSLHSVIMIALALRSTILRSLKQSMGPLESYILGNVYFSSTEVPSGNKDNSAVVSFRPEESNTKGLSKKLSMSKKKYLKELTVFDEEREHHDIRPRESIFDDDDIFCIPNHNT